MVDGTLFACLEKFLWKIEYTLVMHGKVPWMGWLFCWQSAEASAEDGCVEDDMTPEEAVDSEMSYWEE